MLIDGKDIWQNGFNYFQRLLQCSQCGKAFLELCDLKRHVKRHLLKRAKNASKDLANKYQESAANISVQPVVPGMNSLNLMVLPDSILFTEAQQLLDNSGSTAAEVFYVWLNYCNFRELSTACHAALLRIKTTKSL